MVEGYVLHGVPWRETSLIAEVFTRDEGRLGLVARGARRPRSAMRGLLQPFQKLGLRYSHKGELRTLMAAEWLGTQ
ncbi:MAG: recombination protein O N-terminal domain-containing protein, partial [Proteobacteria bacterium]|nr:recombination protein O N-terminal domain-containing protein [Pseudomonadota bacterium]